MSLAFGLSSRILIFLAMSLGLPVDLSFYLLDLEDTNEVPHYSGFLALARTKYSPASVVQTQFTKYSESFLQDFSTT